MLTNFDKAIVGGLSAAILAELARYGFHPTTTQVTTLGVVLTAVVPYVIGHAVVYFTKNKGKL